MSKYLDLFFFGIVFFFATTSSNVAYSWDKSPIALQNYPYLFLLTQKSENTTFLLEQGKLRFANGQFLEAANLWQKASIAFEHQGDKLNQAWSLSYLSLAYQHLGEWQKAQTTINHSLKLLQHSHTTINYAILAVALNTQGKLNLSTGKAELALKSWQEAERAYIATGDKLGEIGSKINQAQALQAMGLYRRAKNVLIDINQQLQQQQDSPLKLKALRSLGVTLQVVGDFNQSEAALAESLKISNKLNLREESSEILMSLGNTQRSVQNIPTALNYYQQAVANTINLQVKVEALLNQLSLYIEISQNDYAKSLISSIETQLTSLPPSRNSIYASINFAKSISELAEKEKDNLGKHQKYQKAENILEKARNQAEELGDLRAKAYVLNELSKLYSLSQKYHLALELSQQSLKVAQEINAADIFYQAAWQIGRISNHLGDKNTAYSAYKSSVETLKSLRSDLVAINSDVQFSFQKSVEPVYREYVSLLLEESNPGEEKLQEARKVIEALQLAELDNFFREVCIDTKPENIDKIDQTAAVIYPIILPDRLEVILSVPGKASLSKYRIALPEAEIGKTIGLMRQSLNPVFSSQVRSQVSQQLYNWLIRPAEVELSRRNIETLVFVLDGSLRNLPMSGLHDGKQYLIEKYNIALSPGLQLMRSQPNQGKHLKVIAAGLSEARQDFKPLPGVELEIAEITANLSTKTLLNQDFTNSKIRSEIKSTPFTVLHLATHGQFSSQSEETFIVTWDGKIKVKQLDELLAARTENESSPIELIVLSACQTAKGDNRAILGLAGMAVRSGARSTLGTLWAVQDESTAKFMSEFYKQLRQPGISKAEALRNTQISFLKNTNQDFQHPFYWAGFVLIGNWL
ncbi:CHAT domain-containing protein [Calothrix sp. UHCC 0171]|uniref:CHAT domain-containing protein n=1 Tax=Calothrix sp. UHCC 0171 TaxID=3110245 RepID=UPI002B217FBD|nr:CHAT domain-containing protein [Calothrix sp. UHCC 0171]MEA5570038.1 CHAT domain-containing protein [Calothrix sp. UHCC 0171]